MEKLVSKSQFKPHALKYFRLIEETGETVIITDRGKPVLKVMPYKPTPEDSLKMLRHSVLEYHDPTEPVAAEDWKALK